MRAAAVAGAFLSSILPRAVPRHFGAEQLENHTERGTKGPKTIIKARIEGGLAHGTWVQVPT